MHYVGYYTISFQYARSLQHKKTKRVGARTNVSEETECSATQLLNKVITLSLSSLV
jgi:hypothetical protein